MPINPQATQLKILACVSEHDYAFADIAIAGSELTVSLELAHTLLALYPSLAQHACKSGPSATAASKSQGRGLATATFGAHLQGALLPHAVEHLAIELLVEAHPGQVFAGNTTWLSRDEQTMRVRVSLAKQDISAAHDAISGAVGLLNRLLSSDSRQTGEEALL